jgi:hypothetical protein
MVTRTMVMAPQKNLEAKLATGEKLIYPSSPKKNKKGARILEPWIQWTAFVHWFSPSTNIYWVPNIYRW